MTDRVPEMDRPALRRWLDPWFCGCESPEAAAASLLRLLALFPLHVEASRRALSEWLADDGVRMLLLYALDEHHLIEHGSTIGGSWLTPTGEAVRAALEREQADGFSALFRDACSHGYDIDDETHDCAAVR